MRGGKERNRRFSAEHEQPQAFKDSRMNVLFLTIFISTALALFFVGAFLYHHDFSGGDALRELSITGFLLDSSGGHQVIF